MTPAVRRALAVLAVNGTALVSVATDAGAKPPTVQSASAGWLVRNGYAVRRRGRRTVRLEGGVAAVVPSVSAHLTDAGWVLAKSQRLTEGEQGALL